MSNWHSRVGLSAVTWIGLTVAAIAQSGPDHQLPTGDVWIIPDHPYLFRPRPAEINPSPETALGDVWIAPDPKATDRQ
jgi:hypothetical protein